MTHWVGNQGGLEKLAKYAATSPHYDVTPRKPQIQNEKIFFFRSQLEDLLNP